MIQGKIKNLIPLLKGMLITRINKIDFKDKNFNANGVEDVLSYNEDMLNMINGIYQDYIVGAYDLNTILEINLKTFTYKRI